MPALIYLHGFLSSPASSKAVQTRDWLAANRPDIAWECPQLTPSTARARATVDGLLERHLPGPVYLIGSSLGGYYATWYAETADLRAVLVNPATRPGLLEAEYAGVPLRNYHTGDTYLMTAQDIADLKAIDTPVIHRPENYWLMVQTGDETLDYALAVAKYAGCRQLVEQGGSHSFENFARWIPAAIDFLTGED